MRPEIFRTPTYLRINMLVGGLIRDLHVRVIRMLQLESSSDLLR